MQSYIAKVYTSANPDLIETVTLAEGKIDTADLCRQLALTLWECDMRDTLTDASNGEVSIEQREDLGEPGQTTVVLYDIPHCERDADLREGGACDAHECDCEGDIYLITLDPTE